MGRNNKPDVLLLLLVVLAVGLAVTGLMPWTEVQAQAAPVPVSELHLGVVPTSAL